MKCLHKKPGERFPSAAALAEALRRLGDAEQSSSFGKPMVLKRSRNRIAMALAIGIFAFALVSCISSWQTIQVLLHGKTNLLVDNTDSIRKDGRDRSTRGKDGPDEKKSRKDAVPNTDNHDNPRPKPPDGYKKGALVPNPGPVRRALRFRPPKNIKLPEVTTISVYELGGRNSFQPKPVGTISTYNDEIRLPSNRKYEVWWKGKIGRDVCMIPEIAIKDTKVLEIHADEYMGVIRVSAVGMPKLTRLVIGKKGTYQLLYPRIVQFDDQYGRDLVVPAGTYEVHLELPKPAPRRMIQEKLIVTAGRVVVVD